MGNQQRANSRTNSTSSYKIAFLGDAMTGKTSVLHGLVRDGFLQGRRDGTPTDLISKTVTFQNQLVHLQLQNTPGQGKYCSLVPLIIRGSHAVIIVQDAMEPSTFDNVQMYVDEARRECGAKILVQIVGNKVDQGGKMISTEKGREMAIQMGAHFQEVSAMTDMNMEALFQDLLKQLKVQDSKIKNSNETRQ